MVQISVPSRERVPEYASEKRRTDEIVGRINGRFSRDQWIPVNFLYRSFSQRELAGFYNEADVCLVTPFRDGMNLVAKEYVASRDDRPGVLVLSKFCGSAETMTDALIVNPYDIKGTADAIHRGIAMGHRERARRWTPSSTRCGRTRPLPGPTRSSATSPIRSRPAYRPVCKGRSNNGSARRG